MHNTAVSAGSYGLSVSMGNQFSTDYLTMVASFLMISTPDPMNFNSGHMLNKSTLEHICGHLHAKNALSA